MDGAVATTGSDVVERPGSSSERVLARHADLLNAVAIALAAIAIRVDHNYRGHYFWQNPPTPAVEAAPAPAK